MNDASEDDTGKSRRLWGTVDGFDPPSGMRGFVVLTDDDGSLHDGVEVEIWVNGALIGTALPSKPRPDVTGNADYRSAWSFDLPFDSAMIDFAFGRVQAIAVDVRRALKSELQIWPKITEAVKVTLCLSFLRSFDAESIGRSLDIFSRSEQLSQDSRSLIS